MPILIPNSLAQSIEAGNSAKRESNRQAEIRQFIDELAKIANGEVLQDGQDYELITRIFRKACLRIRREHTLAPLDIRAEELLDVLCDILLGGQNWELPT